MDDNREICRSICSTYAFAALIIDCPGVIQPRATPRRITGVNFYDRYVDLREYTDSDAEAGPPSRSEVLR